MKAKKHIVKKKYILTVLDNNTKVTNYSSGALSLGK